MVDQAGDVVIESLAGAAGGTHLVRSAVDFDLSGHANIEKLTLTGTAVEAIGNSLANTLTGNAEGNLLDGASGKDTMIGGAGDDTYIVDMVGDVVTETLANSKDGGIDTVRSATPFRWHPLPTSTISSSPAASASAAPAMRSPIASPATTGTTP